MKRPEIEKMLVLSTGHLKQETCGKWLTDAQLWLPLWDKDQLGWFLYVFEDATELPEPIPEELQACLEFARKHKASWLMFDRDGPQEDSLSWFDW